MIPKRVMKRGVFKVSGKASREELGKIVHRNKRIIGKEGPDTDTESRKMLDSLSTNKYKQRDVIKRGEYKPKPDKFSKRAYKGVINQAMRLGRNIGSSLKRKKK